MRGSLSPALVGHLTFKKRTLLSLRPFSHTHAFAIFSISEVRNILIFCYNLVNM